MRTIPVLAFLVGCGGTTPTEPIPEPAPEPVAEKGPGGCPAPEGDVADVSAALAAPHRSEEERARDVYRHPAETLAFFGLQEDMTVLELWPGGGWYTAVLAPVLAEEGTLIATNFDPEGPEDESETRYGKRFQEKLASNAEVFGKVETVIVDPPDDLDLGEPGSVDLAVTFRNNHSWIGDGFHEKVYAEVFEVLKPCGVLGVVQHRAEAGAPPESAEKGYVSEEVVIAAAEKAGFVLAERSEINANPKDTKDYEKGVWTLPPSYRLGEQDREKYAAIGESDRMTLKFVKPATD